jgi:hypothetical protein
MVRRLAGVLVGFATWEAMKQVVAFHLARRDFRAWTQSSSVLLRTMV